MLDSLGYCEFDFDSRMVYTVPLPSSFANDGLPKAVLAGARIPSLIAKIKIAVRSRRERAGFTAITPGSHNINIPASIVIEAVDTLTIQEIANEAGIKCLLERPAAWDLVNFSSSIDEVQKSLQWEKRQEQNWKCDVFITDKLSFWSKAEESTGYKLVAYQNPVDQQWQHWLRDGERAAAVERDWGRYITLSSAGLSVLLYDENHYKLAVPVTVPLPCILARALAMCTGVSPIFATTEKKAGSIPSRHPVQIYSGVPPIIAKLIAEKAGQKITPACLENEKGEVVYD